MAAAQRAATDRGGYGCGGIAGTGAATRDAADPGIDLDQIRKQLDAELPLTPGMRWFVNEKTQSVEISLPESSTKTASSAIDAVAATYGNAVSYTRHPYGVANAEMNGGVFIGSPGPAGGTSAFCTLGFNMINVSAQIYYAATAGHCTWDTGARTVREYWYTNPNYTVYLGNEASTHLGNGEDFGLIRYANDNLSRPGSIHSYKSNKDYDITGSGWATSPDYVCKSGRTTGTTCGRVIYSCMGVDYLVEGVARRLECAYETDLCTAGGDSGGPMWKGAEAIGIHIAGNGGWNGSWSNDAACGANHRSWEYRVPFIEAAYGYIVY